MAFNPSNSHWIPNFSSDGTNITIPIASIPNLTAAEAHTTTGDIRKLLYHLEEFLNSQWVAEGAAGQPAQMTLQKGQSLNPSNGQIVATYSRTFVLAAASIDVTAEPA